MRVIAFDSKKVLRKRPEARSSNSLKKEEQFKLSEVLHPEFKALLGAGITIHDYKKFSEGYNSIIDELFKENGVSRNKLIYKSRDLLSIFHGLGVDIIPLVAEKLIEKVEFIDIYYSYFLNRDSDKQFKIGVYWEEQLETKSAAEFIDLIEGPYPAICCYAYLSALRTQIDEKYFIDDCPGLRPNAAIIQVIKNNSTHFVFKGDQVNYAISAADIICKYIDMTCLKNGFNLNKFIVQNMEFDDEKCKTTFIGPDWLRQIKPSHNINLNVNHKYPHPIFFFFPDHLGPFSNKSKDILEESRLFSLALDKSCELGGCVKFFDLTDQKFITKEDFLVTHNKLSLEKIDELNRLACPATKIDGTFFEK